MALSLNKEGMRDESKLKETTVRTNYFRALTVTLALVGALLASTVALPTLSDIRAAEATTAQSWNLAEDFQIAPNQANPSPDSYENKEVWHYMRSSGRERDAATYSLLEEYGETLWCLDPVCDPSTSTTAKGWRSPENRYEIPFLVKRSSDGQILVHPTSSLDIDTGTFPDSNSVVGWRSPITGKISISGEVRDGHVSCCDGIK